MIPIRSTSPIAWELAVPFDGVTVFESLLRHQPVAYSAFLNLPDAQILSLSPELFFRIDQGRITTRPMKGTMPRGVDLADDRATALRLKHDEKNRSEHVMIVDLLRNDLGRICTMVASRRKTSSPWKHIKLCYK